MTLLLRTLLPPWDAPLDPSPDRARSLVRRELLRPEYHDRNLLQQFLDWLQRRFEDGLDAASRASDLGTLGALVVFLVVLILLGWVLSKVRRVSRARTAPAGAVLTEEVVSAAELRQRALAALADGRHEDALVEGFRALALRQIERGRLEDQPGATAHEVALSLGSAHPDRRPAIEQAASWFDLVRYGDRPATREQAESVLGLDDALAPVR